MLRLPLPFLPRVGRRWGLLDCKGRGYLSRLYRRRRFRNCWGRCERELMGCFCEEGWWERGIRWEWGWWRTLGHGGMRELVLWIWIWFCA
eukprot:187723-Amorphochlora_amoeboformis.AAC.1